MRIFERGGKTNFVDENNVLVGFDSCACCCENFGHFFTRKPAASFSECSNNELVEKGESEDWGGYVFDKTFIRELDPENKLDTGGAVMFRLTKNDDEVFLVLHNAHNGYYHHGFDMKDNGKVVHSGIL